MSASKSARKFFLCTGQCVAADQLASFSDSHIIGELRYVLEEGEQVTALAVYDRALPCNVIPPIYVQIRLEIIGDARKIKCTYLNCLNSKRWEMGKVAVRQLLQRYQRAML